MRDYFYDYFTDYFAIILRLYRIIRDYFFLLFTIISRHGHQENGNVQTAILDQRLIMISLHQ
jgi:hypothetical protein